MNICILVTGILNKDKGPGLLTDNDNVTMLSPRPPNWRVAISAHATECLALTDTNLPVVRTTNLDGNKAQKMK